MDKKLEEYIKKCFKAGIEESEIQATLIKQGWETNTVNQTIDQIKINLEKQAAILSSAPAPKKKSGWSINLKALSASQVLLYLGGLIVLIAGITYISTNWTQWGPAARIAAICIPMLISFGAGASFWYKDHYKKQALLFLTTGALLFPLFLIVLFNELFWFMSSTDGSVGLAISLITFLLYIGISFLFRFSGWTFLYLVTALFVYYFFWQVLGIGYKFDDAALFWLFLIPGTLYLFLAILFAQMNKHSQSRTAYVLGALILVVSFIGILDESAGDALVLLLLAFIGCAYFANGIFIELKVNNKLCQVPYFIGTGVVLASLVYLGSEGEFLKVFDDSRSFEQEAVGWSMVIVGILYYVIARLITQLKKINVVHGLGYAKLFDLISPFFVLGAVLFLGSEGHHAFYETLLLLLSLGLIFGSIPMRSRKYLYTGTLFLVVYIFAIGGEYFQDSIGWPITLFVTGLLSMGIGISIEKVRRKYFPSHKAEKTSKNNTL